MTPRTVLVPLDGSAETEAVLPAAAALARLLEARLLLVHPVSARAFPALGVVGPEEARVRAVARAREYLHALGYELQTDFPFLQVSAAVPSGPMAEAVLDAAALERADLIVCSRRFGGEPGVARIGRTAETLARCATAPVILLPVFPAALAPFTELRAAATAQAPRSAAECSGTDDAPAVKGLRVLVPLNGSPANEAVLPLLVQFAARVPLSVRILHVVAPPGEAERSPAEHGVGAMDYLSTRRHVRATGISARHLCWANAAAYCRHVVGWLEQHGVRAQLELRSGSPVEEIGRAALAGTDLVALGVAQASPWSFTETAECVLRTCTAPVLVLRSGRRQPVVPECTPAASEPEPEPEVSEQAKTLDLPVTSPLVPLERGESPRPVPVGDRGYP